MDRAVVVGAGIGGLATAMRLINRGVCPLVLERASAPGGKLRTLDVGATPLPAGPTVLTMPWVFEELFQESGERLNDHVTLIKLDPLCRHFFPGGSSLDLRVDEDRSADAIGDFAGSNQARAFKAFRVHTRKIYEAVIGPYMTSPLPNAAHMISGRGLRAALTLPRIDAGRTMWAALSEFFSDQRLLALFGRYATYAGSSPFRAPATLNVISHVEQAFGVHTIVGGLERLSAAMVDVIVRRGGRLLYDREVDEVTVRDGRFSGVTTTSGERFDADIMFWNGEPAALSSALGARAPKRIDLEKLSLSALLVLARVENLSDQLPHHSVVFPSSYAEEHNDLFRARRTPRAPTVYACAPDRDTSIASGRAERVTLLINAPAGVHLLPTEVAACRARIMETISQARLSLAGRIVEERTVTPQDFAARFPGSQGALYGEAHRSTWSAMSRPANEHPDIGGLYRVGGSTHPGAGLPMVALSASIATRLAFSYLDARASKRHRSRVDINGGISTA